MYMWSMRSGEFVDIISSKFPIFFLSLLFDFVVYKQNIHRPINAQIINCLMRNRLVYLALGRRSTCSVCLVIPVSE